MELLICDGGLLARATAVSDEPFSILEGKEEIPAGDSW